MQASGTTNDNNDDDCSVNSTSSTLTNRSTGSRPGWSGLQKHAVLHQESKNNNECILFNSGSTLSIFKDENLVMDVGKLKQQLLMSTNAGQRQVTKEATVPKFGKVWFIRMQLPIFLV